ncbi:MAG: DUF4388 domain-containing protein [Acidobacteria bacterium]|nr:DUF4388 domain-containing protein [Acidobacteriota bacterium]
MALQGTLRDFSLADILQLIGLQRKTGILRISGNEDTVSVFFEKGKIVGAESEKKRMEDRLGNVLLKTDKLTQNQLNRILALQRETGRRIGDLLIQEEILSSDDLGRALVLQVTQIIYRLFRWSKGEFRFAQTTAVETERNSFHPIAVDSILMEGMRILDEWPLIERRVRSFQMVLVPTEPDREIRAEEASGSFIDESELDDALGDIGGEQEPEEPQETATGLPEVVTVSANELRVYVLLDGRRSVQEIIDRSDLGDFETCKALFGLMETDLIGEVEAVQDRPSQSPVYREFLDRTLTAAAALLGSALLLAGSWHHLQTFPGAALAPYGAITETVETLRLSASQSRLARLEFGVRLFALHSSKYPETLGDLAAMGLIVPAELEDPWGRPYDYILTRRSYQIRGADGSGNHRPELILTGRIESQPTSPSAFSSLR